MTKAFGKYRINPKYNYFISGSDVYPNAIIGIDKSCAVESDLWKKIDMPLTKMHELVRNMKDNATTLNLGMPVH